MTKRIVSRSEQETRDVAKDIITRYLDGARIKPFVILLHGDLGVGKTAFVKEIGAQLGISDIVSPSFTIYDECRLDIEGLNYLYHFDLYRITDPEEFDHLGMNEIVQPGNILAIEWSEKSEPIQQLLKDRCTIVQVYIKHVDETTRDITVIESEE